MTFQKQKTINYISRKKAAEKLKISIDDFQELCLITNLKAKEAKKKQKYDNEDTVFYKLEDIQKLLDNNAYDILLKRNRMERIKKNYIKRRQLEKAENLKTVNYDYKSLIKEKYKNFNESVIGLNESINILYFYNNIIQENVNTIDCIRENISEVLNKFKEFVKKNQILQKVFQSTKGIYYLIKINNIEIFWLEPYKTSVDIQELDLFEIIHLTKFCYYHVEFSLFKLNTIKIEYNIQNIFNNTKFYLHDENEPIKFLIEYTGGEIIDNSTNADFYITFKDISNFNLETKYVQPQFIYDCFNQLKKLNYKDYIVGKKLPEQICPFKKDNSFEFDEKLLVLMSKKKRRNLEEIINENEF